MILLDGFIFNVAAYGASAAKSAAENVVAIRAALAAAKSVGGGVVVLPEMYSVDGDLELSSNIALTGLGHHTGLRMLAAGSSSRLIKNAAYTATLPSEQDVNISISDMTFDMRSVDARHAIILHNVNGVIIDNCHILGAGDSTSSTGHGGINIGGFTPDNTNPLRNTCYNVRVSDCFFSQLSNFAVQFGNVIDGVIRGNIAYDCYREVYGVEPISSLVAGVKVLGRADNISITGNTVRTGVTGSTQGTPTGVIVVTGNTASESEYLASNITVTGNTIETLAVASVANIGITVLGAEGVSIIGNTIRGLPSSGIVLGNAKRTVSPSVKNCTVVGNTVLDCNQNSYPAGNGQGAGISLRNAQGNNVSHNIVKGAKHAMPVELTNGSTTANNTLIGNG